MRVILVGTGHRVRVRCIPLNRRFGVMRVASVSRQPTIGPSQIRLTAGKDS